MAGSRISAKDWERVESAREDILVLCCPEAYIKLCESIFEDQLPSAGGLKDSIKVLKMMRDELVNHKFRIYKNRAQNRPAILKYVDKKLKEWNLKLAQMENGSS